MDIAASLADLWQAISNFDVNEFIQLHGNWFYVITFVWTFLEGETFVLFAGAAAAQDILDIRMLIAISWLGSYCGDQTYFYLGRTFGPGILKRWPKMQKGADKVASLILKYDVAFILTYRFIYGLRNVSSFAMGLSGLDWKKFAFWNFWAAGIWAVVFSMVGYLFGEVLDNVLGHAIETVMLSLLGLVAVIYIGKQIWKRVKKNRGEDVGH
ncbi:MAG: DedA family protein [Alphaproteobacteria bacterium]|nr:DedA family protein [Alphaproteobacteria bacterium]